MFSRHGYHFWGRIDCRDGLCGCESSCGFCEYAAAAAYVEVFACRRGGGRMCAQTAVDELVAERVHEVEEAT